MEHPLANAARGLVRAAGGEAAVDRFDDALDDYGPEKAVTEALAGAAVGVGIEELRRRARKGTVTPEESARAPNIEQRALESGSGVRLTVDVAHDELEVVPYDDVLVLRTPWGYFEHALGFTVHSIDWRTEAGAAISEFEVRPDVVEVEYVDSDVLDDDDEDPEETA